MKFFVSCPLGFEKELAREITEILPFLKGSDFRFHAEEFQILEVEKGGISIETSLQLGLQLNYFSKLAHRILLRVAEFKAFEFYQLETQLRQEVKLSDYGLSNVLIDVECSQSKLGQEKRVLQTAEKVFGPNQQTWAQNLKIRIFQDVVTVSLDTSGEHLHKRGYRKTHGGAPLRENLAAFMIRKMILGVNQRTPRAELSEVTLLDPFCGTGTLLLESALLYTPQTHRSFAFQAWPKGVPFSVKDTPKEKAQCPFQALIGRDLATDVLQMAQQSAATVGLNLELAAADFRVLKKTDFASTRLWILSNPPYGERLERDFDLDTLWDRLVDLAPEKMALILPEKDIRSLSRKRQPQKTWALSNGGLRVDLALWEF